MKTRKVRPVYFLFLLALVASLAFSVAIAESQDSEKDKEEGKSTAVENLPAPVKAAVEEAAPGGKALSASLEEEEDDYELYEVVVRDAAGKTLELLIAPAGQLVEIEEEVKESSLPPEAQKTLAEVLPGGKTLEIEKKMVVIYEVEKQVGDAVYMVKLSGEGKLLSVSKENEDDDEEDDD